MSAWLLNKMDSLPWFLGLLFGAVILLCLSIAIPTWAGTYYSQRASCRSFAAQTERETKFEVLVQPLGVPVEWQCFVATSDGRWIPRENLREFGESP